jgi:hypothetical protein
MHRGGLQVVAAPGRRMVDFVVNYLFFGEIVEYADDLDLAARLRAW